MNRLVVTDKQRRIDIIRHLHQGLDNNVKAGAMSSHLGRTSTFQKLSSRFYWYTIVNDVHKFVTDMKEKANIFNTFFAEQYAPLKNDSKLPSNQIFLTQSRLCSLDFNEDKILKIIRALDIHKARGHDDISIRMIKICDKSLLKHLIILFQNSTKSSHYPNVWKKPNIIPVHKKNDKQLVKNY